MKSKLFAILILGVLLINLSSAVDWDNVMSYDEDTNTITIVNTLGLGQDLIEAQLTENLCIDGRFCQATKQIEHYEEGELISDFKTLRIDDDSWEEQNIRWHKLEYWGTINDYETQCYEEEVVQENGTYMQSICEAVIIGDHEEWIRFDEGDIFQEGNYTVKTSGEIKPGRMYDWQIKIKGKWTTPWATWGNISLGDDAEVILNSPVDDYVTLVNEVQFNCSSNVTGGSYLQNMSLWSNESGNWEVRNSTELNSLGVGAVSYYKLDETTGTALDLIGDNDGIVAGVTQGVSGLINKSYEFTSESSDNINLSFVPIGTDFSFSFWAYRTSNPATALRIIDNLGTNTGISIRFWGDDASDGLIVTIGNGGGFNSANSGANVFPLNDWVHYVVIGADSINRILIYEDNVLRTNDSWTDSMDWGANDLIIGNSKTIANKAFAGKLDEVGFWNKTLTTSEVSDLYDSGNGARPIASITNSTQTYNRTLTDTILWSCQSYDTDEGWGFAEENRTLFIDPTSPNITLSSPISLTNYGYLNKTENLNWTVTDSNLESCWYDYNGTNTTVTCGDNQTNITLEENNFNLTFYANDSVGNENSEFINWSYRVFENNRTHNSTSFETKSETFKINLVANTSLTSVTLEYNGTEYSTTESGNTYSRTIDITTGVNNNTIKWKFTYAGSTINSLNSYQDVSLTRWNICNGTYTNDFLNVSFKDEQSLDFINASIPLSTFEYYLGSGTVTKTYQYSNTTNHFNYTFCATPDLTFNVDPLFQYKQGLDYPQRIANPTVQQYASTVTNTILYLLSSLDGIFVTFQVINSAEQGISNVQITGTREIASETVTVANGQTDSAGAATFWLNPDFIHTFNFSKTGFDDFQFVTAPTQSAYTITLGGGAPVETDCTRGVSYSINPRGDYLDKNTNYNFSFGISSSYWALDNFTSYLYYGNGTLIDSDISTTQEGGTLSFLNINTTNQSTMYLNYSYALNGSTCISTSKVWILQSTDGRDFSIFRLFADASSYMDANIFGINGESGTDTFSRSLIAFFILVVVAGITTTRYGIGSETAVMGIIFGTVLLLDVGFGIIPTLQVGTLVAVDYFLSAITFLIFMVFLIREESR